MITTSVTEETSTLIRGPEGALEVITSKWSGDAKAPKTLGIVCHPHPLFGGNMNNKVVTTLAKTFQGLGIMTVRFNFRGVGKSEGQFDHGNGEVKDLLAVMDWLQQEHPDCPLWLAGFSFGAYVVAKAATFMAIAKLVLVAPPVRTFAMDTLSAFPCPWVLVQGELDDVVSPAEVFAWANHRNPKPTLLRFPKAGHFFHGQLIELRKELEKVLGRVG